MIGRYYCNIQINACRLAFSEPSLVIVLQFQTFSEPITDHEHCRYARHMARMLGTLTLQSQNKQCWDAIRIFNMGTVGSRYRHCNGTLGRVYGTEW